MKAKFLMVFSILFISINAFSQNQMVHSNEIKDIDGNKYPIIFYRGYSYMTENLKVTKFLNGDQIIESKDKKEWKRNCSKAVPTYMVNKNYPELGFIYNGYAVYDSRGLLPEEYVIPADSIFYEEYWKNYYKGNEKNREAFEIKLLGDLYISSSAYNSDCSKSKSFFIEPDGIIKETPCVGGRWWMEEGESFKHTDNSFSTACCTGLDGAHHGDFFKPDWQSWGFYVRGIKKQ